MNACMNGTVGELSNGIFDVKMDHLFECTILNFALGDDVFCC